MRGSRSRISIVSLFADVVATCDKCSVSIIAFVLRNLDDVELRFSIALHQLSLMERGSRSKPLLGNNVPQGEAGESLMILRLSSNLLGIS
jgi:hypothetical protein